MSEVLLTRILEDLLLPPGGPLLLLILALLLWRRRLPAFVLAAAGTLMLYLAAVPAVGYGLVHSLERHYPPLDLSNLQNRSAGAIVVFGAARRYGAPEYGGDDVSDFELARLRYAARLARRTNLPVLVSGGRPLHEQLPEAELMRRVLAEDFHVATVWTEPDSRTTHDNARNSAALLSAKGIHRIFLVTHARHMARAVASFRGTGMEIIPAPIGYADRNPLETGAGAWLPNARALYRTREALHEYIGQVWYRVRY